MSVLLFDIRSKCIRKVVEFASDPDKLEDTVNLVTYIYELPVHEQIIKDLEDAKQMLLEN